VKIRAEDGRSITGVDIYAVINNLPKRLIHDAVLHSECGSSEYFSSKRIEALEAGARLLLVDEDTAAAMIRDRRITAVDH